VTTEQRPVLEPSLDPIPAEIHEHRLPNTRVAGGVCWSLLVAEMAAERTQPAPNPWTPEGPEEAA
jgi:hypothetical protein